jgi:serine/threonine-protein kinase
VQRTRFDGKREENGDFLPWALPDGRHFLYFKGGTPKVAGIYIGSLDVEPDDQDRTRLMPAQQQTAYVPPAAGSAIGYLVFMREGLLTAQPFDAERRQLRGEPMTIVEQVSRTQILGSFGVSATGSLAYLRANSDVGSIVLVGRDGQATTTIASSVRSASNPRLSPDGRSLAVVISGEVWRYELDGRPPIKLTFNGRFLSPLWSRDGQRVVTEHSGQNQLAAVPSDGSGGTPQQASPKGHFHPHAWTADGTEIIAAQLEDGGAKTALVRFPARADGQVQTIVATSIIEGFAGALSPDGRWLAYTSESTGRTEIWVRPLPGPGPAVRLSSNGGTEPIWARNSKELYYIEGGNMMAVSVETGATFDFKPAVRLFESVYGRSDQSPSYDVTPDGRFVMIKSDNAGQRPISVILNWQERLSAQTAH